MEKDLMFSNEYAYIWLQRVLGIGSERATEVLETFLENKEICQMSYNKLAALNLFNKTELSRAAKIMPATIKQTVKYCKENSIRIVTFEDEEYPENFRRILAPPVVLFVRGEKLLSHCPYIAIVGTRKATEFGQKAAYSLGARLTVAGFTVVSGGAVGVDSMAHIGALKAGGKTIAVLGCGHDSGYLKSRKEMRKDIEKSGAVISEFEPKTSAGKHTFPIRNRLISALSVGVAVIEAGAKSGALITATYAMEQGKEVFAVPGNINNPQYVGTNELIRDGAIPLITSDDVISVYIGRFGDKIGTDTTLKDDVKKGYYELVKNPDNISHKEKAKAKKAVSQNPVILVKPEINCSKSAQKILNSFNNETEMSDVLSQKSGLSGSEFISAITELELSGVITAVPVGRYKLINNK